MRVLFMGTPEFAVASLQALDLCPHEIVGVVTAPDKPVGRGLRVKPSPVKENAMDLNLPVIQPSDLKASGFLEEIDKLGADIFVVVAFRILPSVIFELPPLGTVNLHASLLPKYRGAAPINWAIINGEKETGVTTIFIRKEVDAGDIILQEKVPIGEDETAGELHDKLSVVGARLLVKTVDRIAKNNVVSVIQRREGTRAPKLNKETGRINWKNSNKKIKNLVRGLSPSPGAYSYLNGKLIKFFQVRMVDDARPSGEPGEVVNASGKEGILEVATGRGNLLILELQPEGKRRMTASEYLRGYKVQRGVKFGSAR